MQTQDFLCELGCEELPPKELLKLSTAFANEVTKDLTKLKLSFTSCKSFATPRRLAIVVKDLASKQSNISKIITGPSIKNVFDVQGTPTAAALGFARKCGVDVTQLDASGDKLTFKQNINGKNAVELVPNVISQSLVNLPIAKRMRWGLSKSEFVRPVKWLVMLFGNELIECEILTCKASRNSYGHRFLHSGKVAISHPQNYEQNLQQAFVAADFNERKAKIMHQIECLAQSINAKVLIPSALLDEVTALVEYPHSLLCEFDKSFLEIPQEALIATMQDNQKYFCLVDDKNKLLPNFITVANIAPNDVTNIVAGNQKVVSARLSDAQFFFVQDKKIGIENFVKQLEKVTFQEQLGTVLAKSERIAKLAAQIADGVGENKELATRAGYLCKADLASNLVGEFPELQGIAGSYYALDNNERREVASAISEHYKPRFAGDDLPSTNLGAIVSLADKIDTLVGIFGIGLIPTGSKDPYALRRAAAGIVRICLEHKLDFTLSGQLTFSINLYCFQNQHKVPITSDLSVEVENFIVERLAVYYSEQNYDLRYFEAVKVSSYSIFDTKLRIKDLQSFSLHPQAGKLIENFKRINNLVNQSYVDNLITLDDKEINCGLLQERVEKSLHQMTLVIKPIINDLTSSHNKQYEQALLKLLEFNEPIEYFFAHVMVNVPNQELRKNRLKLLANIQNLFVQVADFSQL